MRAAADAEMMVRRRQAEVGKEAVRHVDVIVLSGMDQCRHAPVLPLQHVVERRNLHEVGPGRGDKVNLLTRHQAKYPRMCLNRKGVVEGKSVNERLDMGGGRLNKKKK